MTDSSSLLRAAVFITRESEIALALTATAHPGIEPMNINGTGCEFSNRWADSVVISVACSLPGKAFSGNVPWLRWFCNNTRRRHINTCESVLAIAADCAGDQGAFSGFLSPGGNGWERTPLSVACPGLRCKRVTAHTRLKRGTAFMNMHEQLEALLARLGVTMEPGEDDEAGLPEISLFQSSRTHYGVYYRVDLVQGRPQVRVIVPVDSGVAKVEVYLVRLSADNPLDACFSHTAAYRGSPAFEEGREIAEQHLLYAVAETMKQLFWSGDLESLRFPPEIEGERLL